MKNIFFKTIFITFILTAGFAARGLYAAGTDPSSFLSFGSGARAFALGGAYTGIAEDVTASYYNSGALGILQRKEFIASYSVLWENSNYSFIGYALPRLDKGTIGINLVRLYSGSAEGRDVYNMPTNNFDSSKIALSCGYGRQFARDLYMGINGKILNSTLQSSNLNFFAFDLGVYYKPSSRLSAGVNFQNLIGLAMGDTDDKLPVNLKFGAGYKIFDDKMLVACDVEKRGSDSGAMIDGYSVGVESAFFRMLTLRLGKNNRELTTGFGIVYRAYGFDYALAMNDYLGASHRLSLAWKFGESLDEARKRMGDTLPSTQLSASDQEQMLKEEKFKQLYQEAVQDYNAGMFSTSHDKFIKARDLMPQDSLMPVYIERLKTVTEIISQFMSPGKEGEMVRRGVSYYIDGDSKNAVKTIAYALSIAPENFTIERLLNRLEEKTGLKAEKTSAMTGLTLVDQKLYECLIAFRKRDFWAAIDLCEQILVLEPENLVALKRMGSAFYAIGEKVKAKEIWQKAIAIQPDPKLEEFIKKMK